MQRWRKEYLSSLMEAYKTKQVREGPSISVGDVCILKNDQTKRAFWKLCRVSELLTGNYGNVRAAKVEVTSSNGKQVFRRPLQHLTPLEITTNSNDLPKQPAKDAHVHESSTPTASADRPAASVDRPAASVDRPAASVDRPAASVDRPVATAAAQRPKRNAAIIGVLRRQDGLVRQ